MKKILLSILTFIFTITLTSCNSGAKSFHKFNYFSVGQDYESSMYYTDNFFSDTATKFNNELATASLSFAMASFASDTKFYMNKAQNGLNLLISLGFDSLDTNEDYTIKPHADSFGVLFGKKKVGDYTLIAVGTRGANYENEWASNFTLTGPNGKDYAQGFYDGSEIYLRSLSEYIRDYEITGKIKIWTSGFSRAAAVTNIAMGRLDIAIKENNVSGLIGNVSITKDDIYAYCFEAPRGVKFTNLEEIKGNDFNNIFCIINYNDPVPDVAMADFYYGRYGKDVVLTDSITDINFEENLKVIKTFYSKFQNSPKLGDYKIENFKMSLNNKWVKFITKSTFNGWTQGLYMRELVGALSVYGVQSIEFYGEELQAGLRDLFITLYNNGSIVNSLVDLGITMAREILLSNDASIIMDDLLHNRKMLIKDLTPLISAALKSVGADVSATTIINGVKNFISVFARSIDYDLSIVVPLFSKDNLLSLGSAHYPELCLAHLRAMDKNYNPNPINAKIDGRYYSIISNELDAYISIRRNGVEIVKFENEQIVDVGYKYAQAVRPHILQVMLPTNSNYEIVSSSSLIGIEVEDPNKYVEDYLPQVTKEKDYYIYNF